MYTLSVQRDLIAQHFLIGGDWGPENELHSHNYRLAVILEGSELDRFGYLVNILDLESHLEDLVNSYQNSILNNHPAFAGLNPSIEHFARIFCQQLAALLQVPNLAKLKVRIWEDEAAWASYEMEL